jgi:geranylgeranylglycerol-phosphate geranylgeranyltransferase
MTKRASNGAMEYLRLFRIEHSIMLVIAVVAAEAIVLGHLPSLATLVLSIIPPILISMASFAVNDYFDVEVDRNNQKFDRPLVKGAISKTAALTSSMILFVIGIVSALSLGMMAFYIALIFGVLAFLYSYKLKEMFVVGNAYIAFSMVIPFIYGNYVVSNTLSYAVVLVSVVIFLAGFAREVHGMVRDFQGDSKARKVRNLVYYFGVDASSMLAGIMYLAAIMISIWMFTVPGPFLYNALYIVPVLVVDICLLYVLIGYSARLYVTNKRFFSNARNISLAAMALAIVAYLISALAYVRI